MPSLKRRMRLECELHHLHTPIAHKGLHLAQRSRALQVALASSGSLKIVVHYHVSITMVSNKHICFDKPLQSLWIALNA